MSGNSNDFTLSGGAASASTYPCGLRPSADRHTTVDGLLAEWRGGTWWQTLTVGATKE